MSISSTLLPEFDQEIATTRKLLERAPEASYDWSPHPKSMTVRRLVSHLAHIPIWATITIHQDELDLQSSPPMPPVSSAGQALADFDRNAAAARADIANCIDAVWATPWTLKMGDRSLMTLPKAAVVRTFVMNHLIHHRAQLGVYLRLLDVPVPSIYGPSADDNPMA